MTYSWHLSVGRVALATLLLSGCTVVKVSGYTLSAGQWSYDEAIVKQRAAFDLQCSENQLAVTVLRTVGANTTYDTVTQVGVVGCGRRAAYLKTPEGEFVMNSGTVQRNQSDR